MFQYRDAISTRLSSAVLCSCQNVPASKGHGDANFLDWRRSLPALLENTHQKLTLQTKVLKTSTLRVSYILQRTNKRIKKTKQSFNRHQSKDATQLTLVFFLLSLGGIFSCDFQKLSVLFSLSPVETRKHVIALTRYNQKARFLMRLTSWKGPAHLASWATSRGCWLSSLAD